MVITVQMRLVGVNMKPRNHIARAQQSGAGKHTDKREKMSKYKVSASYTVYCETYIEADDLQEAYEAAIELDGGDFTRVDGAKSHWMIDSIKPVE